MQENNLFDRAEERARKTTTKALVLLIIGLIGLFLIFYLPGRADSNRPDLTNLAQDKGKLVKARLIWLDYAFAEGGKDKRYYHFAQLPDYSLVVLSLDQLQHERVNAMIKADPELSNLVSKPYEIGGLVEKTTTKLQTFLKERFSEFQIEGDSRLDANDPRLLYMVTEGKRPASSYWPFLLLLPGILGLFLLYESSTNRRAVRKARDQVAIALPDLSDTRQMDQEAQLELPELNLKIYEPFLVSEGPRFFMVDLTQAGWAYRRTVRYNFVPVNSFLQIHLLDKKVVALPIKGSQRKLDAQLEPLFSYLQEHHPDILLGFGREQQKAFKERIKRA